MKKLSIEENCVVIMKFFNTLKLWYSVSGKSTVSFQKNLW